MKFTGFVSHCHNGFKWGNQFCDGISTDFMQWSPETFPWLDHPACIVYLLLEPTKFPTDFHVMMLLTFPWLYTIYFPTLMVQFITWRQNTINTKMSTAFHVMMLLPFPSLGNPVFIVEFVNFNVNKHMRFCWYWCCKNL